MATETVTNTTDGTFTQDVLDRSHEVPVVVDFWAPWCGPCRVLGPILESLAEEYGERVQVVKLNVDENPQVASQFRVEGIPAVKAFKDGKLAHEFVGALPEPQVRKFFDSIIPSEADKLVAEGARMRAERNDGAARMHFTEALRQQPGHEMATVGLAGILLDEGDTEGARELLEPLEDDPRFSRVFATLHFRFAAAGQDRAALEARLAENEDDAEAHYFLGCVLVSAGEWEPGLEHLLATVRLDRKVEQDGGRLRMLDAFQLLGEDNELTDEFRRRLTNILF